MKVRDSGFPGTRLPTEKTRLPTDTIDGGQVDGGQVHFTHPRALLPIVAACQAPPPPVS